MTPRPKTLILDLYGAYGRRLGDWFAVADLVVLMRALGQDEQAVRSAIWRMTTRSILRREARAGLNGYRLNEDVRESMALGDRRIYGPVAEAEVDDGWVLISFSVPETERQNRYLLRSRLEWLGFGNVSNGLWIAPAQFCDETKQMITRLGLERYVDIWLANFEGFGDVRELVRRAWNLKAIDKHYRVFAARASAIIEEWKGLEPQQLEERAFADYTLTLHAWRKLPFLDPSLPRSLLPSNRHDSDARAAFHELRSMLEAPAFAYVHSVTRHAETRRQGAVVDQSA